MIVVLVSECEDKALPRSRQILAKYLPQVGSRTWLGKISQEGLIALYGELKQQVTKNTSVACYRIRGYSKTEYLWHIGSKKDYHEGSYSFSQSGRLDNLAARREFTTYHKLLRYLVKLAALLHDIGKNNVAFQNKLNPANPGIKDYLRHELVSYLILSDLKNYIFLKENIVYDEINLLNDTCYFSYLADSDKLVDFFNNFVGVDPNSYLASSGDIEITLMHPCVAEKDLASAPAWQLLKLLVVTHHRLPGITSKVTNPDFNKIDNFDYLINNKVNNLKDCLTIKDKQIFCDANYLNQLNALANNTFELLQRMKDSIDFKALNYYTAYYCRPILILADYVGSSDKQASQLDFTKDVIANTVANKPGQSLLEHLKAVEFYGHHFYTQIFNWEVLLPNMRCIKREEIYDVLPIEESTIVPNVKGKQFIWQQECINKLLNTPSVPMFGVLIAGTGSGKTRAIPKIMGALREDIRYTLCLGYRSLTLQTQQEYENIKLNAQYVATVVGGSSSQQVFAATLNTENPVLGQSDTRSKDYAKEGSEILEQMHYSDDDLPFEVIYKNQNISLNGQDNAYAKKNGLDRVYTTKERQILCAPIVLATIDHFIQCGVLSHGAQSKIMLRMMTSDLVLDEIDSYTDEQLVLISRLVFLAGLFGRSVLLSSASITEVLVNALYKQYQHGLAQYFIINQVKSEDRALKLGLFSEYLEEIQVKHLKAEQVSDLALIRQHYFQFTSNVRLHLDKAIPLRRLQTFSTSHTKSEERFRSIFEQAVVLHKSNHEVIQGKNVSVGFVRFSSTANTIDFAKYLLKNFENFKDSPEEELDDYHVLVMSYHAKLLLIDRIANEQVLEKLKRKNKTLAEIREINDRIMPLLKNKYIKNIVIIVSTSPIIETGRDQDYDWAILEPCSTRSIIQAAGRVQRHRRKKLVSGQYNIGLMSEPMKTLKVKDEPIWSRPGVETAPLFDKREKFKPSYIETNPQADILKDVIAQCNNLLPQIILTTTESPVQIRHTDIAFGQLLRDFSAKIDQGIMLSRYPDFSYSYLTSFELTSQCYLLNYSVPDNTSRYYDGQASYLLEKPLSCWTNNYVSYYKLRDSDSNVEVYLNTCTGSFYNLDIYQDSAFIPKEMIKLIQFKVSNLPDSLFFLYNYNREKEIEQVWEKYFAKQYKKSNIDFKYKCQILAQISANIYKGKSYEYNILGLKEIV